MSTSHLVHPDLQPLLAAMPAMAATEARIAAWRAKPAPDLLDEAGLTVEQRHVPGPPEAPPVRVLIYRPETAGPDAPAILHMHGGGHTMGYPEMDDADNRRLSRELGCLVVSVDYRLAPETRFPGSLEDCHAVLKWLHAAAAELRVDPARIVVKGESAGGGLAAGLALLARDRGGTPIAFQCLTSPMLDDRSADASHGYVGEFVWRREDNRYCWAAYLGPEPGDDVSPYAAPARATDLRGLPAAIVSTGALDLFLEEDIEYARRLTRAGVPVELVVYPGAYHGFHTARTTALGERNYRESRDAIASALGIALGIALA